MGYKILDKIWRRMGDLNSRGVAPYTLSKRAPSTTRPILHIFHKSNYQFFWEMSNGEKLGPFFFPLDNSCVFP